MTGIEIGSVSVKVVHISDDASIDAEIIRHEGNPLKIVEKKFLSDTFKHESKFTITGHTAKDLLDLPYRSETECIEKALLYSDLSPDIILSLGGELFTLYTLKDGHILDIVTSTKCAAGTGEFIIQQLKRMNLSLEEGIDISRKGTLVPLSSRCSVHCKSDATHKLNKGECQTADITKSLINILAEKVYNMLDIVEWPKKNIMLIGGISLNKPFYEMLHEKLNKSKIVIPLHSACFEALGAALYAKESIEHKLDKGAHHIFHKVKTTYEVLPSLRKAENLVDYKVRSKQDERIREGAKYILGIDTGSTTTKAALINIKDNAIDASCYLRTHGNPVVATKECIKTLIDIIGTSQISIVEVAVTGSGRELVSVLLGGAYHVNEILAHGRAATEELTEVDTVFEIGGQDSKYISFEGKIPIDYAMNDGCSAGTGSFLEETIHVDLGISVEDISNHALESQNPVGFGERCAAFINSDVRTALQEGCSKNDVIAGIIYSIAKNYISRVVGIHSIDNTILFQGGVALNKAVSLALASITGRKIVVPSRPELMGCLGCGLMVLDLIKKGETKEKNYSLEEFLNTEMKERGTFRCQKCENKCEIKKIQVKEKTYPFGGNCLQYSVSNKEKPRHKEGRNLIKERNELTFEKYGPIKLNNPRGIIGIPKVLTTYEYYPFYSRLINELGYDVMISENSEKTGRKASEEHCFPCKIAYDCVSNLLHQDVDYIFMPHLIEAEAHEGFSSSYICLNTNTMPSIIRSFLPELNSKLLSPVLNLASHSFEGTVKEIVKLGNRLGITSEKAIEAVKNASAHYQRYKMEKESIGHEFIMNTDRERIILLAGKPYVICSSENNFALPQKIVSRGYHAMSVDMLPSIKGYTEIFEPQGNVWKFTQQVSNAIAYTKEYKNVYLCILSCFSCAQDAVMLHDFRYKLSGETFCFLEIDLHTAHIGFETRIGAFLDIIEQR